MCTERSAFSASEPTPTRQSQEEFIGALSGHSSSIERSLDAESKQSLVDVLDQLNADACLLDGILAAGVCAWDTVTRWDPASRGARSGVPGGAGTSAG